MTFCFAFNYLPVYWCSYLSLSLKVCFLISVLLVLFLLVKLSSIWLVTNYKKNCTCLQKASWKIKTAKQKFLTFRIYINLDFSLMCSSSNSRNTISWSASFSLPPLSGPCQATNKILSFSVLTGSHCPKWCCLCV